MDRLIKEIEIQKKLEHRYIVKMIDFAWDSKNVYIIMELCETSLSAFVKKKQHLAEKSCRYFLRMLAEAMMYLRDQNICHFDLKPQNLLLTKEASNSVYILKLCDFGFASISEEEEEQGIKGSPLYMSPEIIITRKYDARADLWSIGVILYECLFGKAPYSSRTMEELIEKVKTKQPIDIPTSPKISAECEDLLTRLLQHDPDKRISFQEFFNHDFVDLKHAPSDENMEKAIEIMTKAVEEDLNKNYEHAYHLYCEGLVYFVPLIDAESGSKRTALRERALTYMKRAEEIKHSIMNPNHQQPSNNPEPLTARSQQPVRTVQNALEPSQQYKTLYEKCYSNSELKNGLEIGVTAEYYAFEKKFEISLETYKRALSILVPLLNSEVDVERKKLLHKQILTWMKDAESIKALLEAQKHIESSAEANEATSNTHCVIS
jgi:serine/threonine-protein kinase ULK/ATG1